MTFFQTIHYASNIVKNLQCELQKVFSWILEEEAKTYYLAGANLLNGG